MQAAYFFLGFNKEDINIPKTNIFDWKKYSKSFNSLLSDLLSYDYQGPKPAEIPNYRKINCSIKRLEDINAEELLNYNYALYHLSR